MMKTIISMGCIICITLFSACSTYQPLLAPCDEYAHFCGKKIPINPI